MNPTGEIILAVIFGFVIGSIFGFSECWLTLKNRHRDELHSIRQQYQRLVRMDQ